MFLGGTPYILLKFKAPETALRYLARLSRLLAFDNIVDMKLHIF